MDDGLRGLIGWVVTHDGRAVLCMTEQGAINYARRAGGTVARVDFDACLPDLPIINGRQGTFVDEFEERVLQPAVDEAVADWRDNNSSSVSDIHYELQEIWDEQRCHITDKAIEAVQDALKESLGELYLKAQRIIERYE